MKNNFEELSDLRQDWVEANRKNNFEDGINNLLTELYPDNAHFIYELLQNAEDVGATEVNFELNQNELKFTHNGRVFNDKDVKAITSIGQGTKASDINKIGKFGIGFKSVFSYTATPKIYSGHLNFQISDLVVPQKIESINNTQSTIMIFPFNNKDKPENIAFDEIGEGLSEINDNTLLFLTNIKEINYKYKDIKNSIIRENIDDIKVSILNKRMNQTSHWLRFKKSLPQSDILFVAIAFNIKKDEKLKKEVIFPIDGEVSIYFPAEKETSKLNFHIHAPFSSTVARDSIKNIPANKELRDQIAEVLCESLKYIRENNFLDFSFLKCLPINHDYLSDFYEPLRRALIYQFTKYDFVPVENESFKPALQCYRASKAIKELIDVELLKSIENKNNIYWIKTPSQLNSREDRFLQSLDEIRKIGDMDLLEKLASINYNIIEHKDDEWFGKLYSFLSDHRYKADHVYKEKWKKLIKVSDDSLNVDGIDCYFSDIPSNDFLIVKKEVYTSNTKIINEKAKRFLESLGIKEIGKKEKIELILKNEYKDNSFPSEEKNLEHIKQFISYYQQNNSDIKFFNKYNFVFVLDENNKNWWCKAENIYIDEPFEKTGLKSLKIILKNIYFLDTRYNQLENSDKKLFLDFLKLLGAKTSLEIKKNSNEYEYPLFSEMKKEVNHAKETRHCEFYNYKIDNLITLLEKQNKEISLLIWNSLLRTNNNFLRAYYKPNAKSQSSEKDSSLILILKENSWIPDRNGAFFKPQDISKDMLPDNFIYDNRSGWLDAIKFGENIRKDKKEYQENKKLIKETTGFELTTLEDLNRVGITEEDLKQLKKEKEQEKLKISLLKNQSSGDTPSFIKANNNETIIIDEDEHQKNISNENQHNINSFSLASTNYQKQNPKELNKIDKFLYEEYEGHCQICGDTFAYKEKNVFKLKSLNIGKNRDVNRKGNTLLLCHKHHDIFVKNLQKNEFIENLPDYLDISIIKKNFKFINFATKNQFYRSPDEEFIRDVYLLPIKLFSENESIKFTEAHIHEFIEVWNSN